MEFVCIEAKAFMEMNEALEAVEKKMRETCGGGICSMDDWIDNQEACMLMNVSPRKLLQLRRSRIIPYSHIDRKVCLLYTSPSPRDRSLSRMPSSA